MVENKTELATNQVMALIADEGAFWNRVYGRPLEDIIPAKFLRSRLVKHEINDRLPNIGDAYDHPVRVGMILLTKLLPQSVTSAFISRSAVVYTIALATMGAEMIYLQRQDQGPIQHVPWDGHVLSRVLSVFTSMAKDPAAELELLLKAMPIECKLKDYARRYHTTSVLMQPPRTYH